MLTTSPRPKAALDPQLDGGSAAVVDIGSNSVRLVIYRVAGAAVAPTFNDRTLAGLGRDLARTGRLHPDGVLAARTALERFGAVLRARKVPTVVAAATAAVREAEDGPEFARQAAKILGAPVRTLSGVEEGRYAALGVAAGDRQAQGVVADLGGASLELTPLIAAPGLAPQTGEGVTLPLGPLALEGADTPSRDQIADSLAGAPDYDGPTLHLVGGSFRNIALAALHERGHPVPILHHFTLEAAEAWAAARQVMTAHPDDLALVPNISKRRIAYLPAAARVLSGLLERYAVTRVTISAYGVREGLLADARPDLWARDPLADGLALLATGAGGETRFAAALSEWLAPHDGLWSGLAAHERVGAVREAACFGAVSGEIFHPDSRANMAGAWTLTAPVTGVTHEERVALALAVAHRYGGRRAPASLDAARGLSTDAARAAAQRLGLALRLMCNLTGRSAAPLRHVKLETGPRMILRLKGPARALASETIERRFAQFAAACEVEGVVEV